MRRPAILWNTTCREKAYKEKFLDECVSVRGLIRKIKGSTPSERRLRRTYLHFLRDKSSVERLHGRLMRIGSGKTVRNAVRALKSRKEVDEFFQRLHGNLSVAFRSQNTSPVHSPEALSTRVLFKMGFTADELRRAGRSPRALLAGKIFTNPNKGIRLRELVESQFSPFELLTFGYSAKDMKQAGFSTEQMCKSFGENRMTKETIADYFEDSGLPGIALTIRKHERHATRWGRRYRALVDSLRG